jgi:hypothetical protein
MLFPGGSTALANGRPAPPVRPTLDAALLSQVRVRALAPDRYEVPATEVQAVLENAGCVLAELAPGVVSSFPPRAGCSTGSPRQSAMGC